MKKTEIFDLGEGRKATINEMTPAMVRNILADLMSEDGDSFKMDFMKEGLNGLMGVLQPCVSLEGCNVDDLSFSEIEQVIALARKVNESFLRLFPVERVVRLVMAQLIPVLNLEDDLVFDRVLKMQKTHENSEEAIEGQLSD